MGGSEPRAGDWLGRYQLVEVLGRGGMGTVWRAHDPQLERDVALKVINPALGQDAEFRERFRREAVVLSRMDSAHVVAVFDHGEQDGAPYLVTQLVRGGDLSAVLRTRGAVEPSYAVDLACQVLEGLADAHAIGVVHRDVKPSNVLLRDDGSTAYLCDFGIATSPGGELTRTGVLVGSAAYMAPERHSGDTGAAGVAGDVYSAGCLLWTMLTGTPPYVGTDAEVAMGHLRGPVPQVPGRDPFLDGLNAVLRRALAKTRAAATRPRGRCSPTSPPCGPVPPRAWCCPRSPRSDSRSTRRRRRARCADASSRPRWYSPSSASPCTSARCSAVST
ncbi:serine/threonine-protein kinase [Nocardioides sp. QY071]|uniref:serine/threonine-protein kinase n=1 Tax=Nocardioides sp. QY071 TaxID=3044187 RepID=UPI00249A94EB|nr:serine/threonine-protein kinase [Nocardioides sp. QY071]WGY02498.1 serine/threonine-protein kinase [Nocardioides sp. QY071]